MSHKRSSCTLFVTLVLLCSGMVASAASWHIIASPDGKLSLEVSLLDGRPLHRLRHKQADSIAPDQLGLKLDHNELKTGFRSIDFAGHMCG